MVFEAPPAPAAQAEADAVPGPQEITPHAKAAAVETLVESQPEPAAAKPAAAPPGPPAASPPPAAAALPPPVVASPPPSPPPPPVAAPDADVVPAPQQVLAALPPQPLKPAEAGAAVPATPPAATADPASLAATAFGDQRGVGRLRDTRAVSKPPQAAPPATPPAPAPKPTPRPAAHVAAVTRPSAARPSAANATAPAAAPAEPGAQSHLAQPKAGAGETPRGETRNAHPLAGNVTPKYPDAAKRAGEQGLVKTLVHVSATGEVVGVDIVETSGSSRLDAFTRRWLMGIPFAPKLENGQAVASAVTWSYNYHLDDTGAGE